MKTKQFEPQYIIFNLLLIFSTLLIFPKFTFDLFNLPKLLVIISSAFCLLFLILFNFKTFKFNMMQLSLISLFLFLSIVILFDISPLVAAVLLTKYSNSKIFVIFDGESFVLLLILEKNLKHKNRNGSFI